MVKSETYVKIKPVGFNMGKKTGTFGAIAASAWPWLLVAAFLGTVAFVATLATNRMHDTSTIDALLIDRTTPRLPPTPPPQPPSPPPPPSTPPLPETPLVCVHGENVFCMQDAQIFGDHQTKSGFPNDPLTCGDGGLSELENPETGVLYGNTGLVAQEQIYGRDCLQCGGRCCSPSVSDCSKASSSVTDCPCYGIVSTPAPEPT